MGGAGVIQVKVEVGWSPEALRSFCRDQLCELGKCFPSFNFSFSFPSLDKGCVCWTLQASQVQS